MPRVELRHNSVDCEADLKIRQVNLGSSPRTLGTDMQNRIYLKFMSAGGPECSDRMLLCVSTKGARSVLQGRLLKVVTLEALFRARTISRCLGSVILYNAGQSLVSPRFSPAEDQRREQSGQKGQKLLSVS